MELTLNGEWQFRQKDKGAWMQADVPGCNYLDLMRLGKIKDPFVGTNEKDVYSVALEDWEYRRNFTVRREMLESDSVILRCDMLDTICDVYVNGRLAGKGTNCHRRFEWDIKDKLHIGENSIHIIFYSPVRYVEKKQAKESCPSNNNGQNGIPHIRKPQCHFGWDWGPVLPPSGISGDIGIIAGNGAVISDLRIKQHHTENRVSLDIHAQVKVLSGEYAQYNLKLINPEGEVAASIDADSAESISHTITVDNPQLWWTHELNPIDEQPLYTITLTLKSISGEALDYVHKKIGLRTLVLNTNQDKWGRNFCFVLNGVPIFVKGANWIPPDSFINRYTDERLQYDLKAALHSNMNMLRIWGGGFYASDRMCDLCDKYGILLWQDFQFACQPYPFFDKEFTENVKAEVEYNVKRLRHHACLAVWCGNNEIESMSIGWLLHKNYIEWTEKFFYHILPEHLVHFDDTVPYIPGSPCGTDHMKGYDSDHVGDTHLWAVWHGLQPMHYYRKRLTRFCSEFGFESLPDMKTIRRFAQPKDYSLTSEVFLSHQKCLSGNMKMVYYIASRFRLPERFEDYVYLSQITQQECVKDAVEHWRRNKGRCNGAMYWQMNDCWPVCSWSGMDYFGNYKALQYTSRHFNAPVAVSIQDEKKEIKIYAVNDTLQDGVYRIDYAVYDYEGREYMKRSRKLELKRTSVTVPYTVSRADIKADEYVLVAQIYKDGVLINRKTYLPRAEKNLHLPAASCTLRTEIKENTAYIYLKSDKYMRLLRVESDINTMPFSDNYFDLLPGEEVCLTQNIPDDMDVQKYLSGLSVRCIQDIVPEKSRAADYLKRLKILLNPINLGNYIYYKRI